MAEKKEKLQALFFDFDGVILDSAPVKTLGFISLFEGYDTTIVDKVVQYHKEHGGISRVEKIKYAHDTIIGKPLTDDDLHLWANNFSTLVLDKMMTVPWIMGAKSFLENQGNNLLIFVISGTPEEELKQIIEKRGMSPYFNEILGSPVKKASHIKMLLNKYKLTPSQCVFIGDALTDYHAAQQTGLHFIGIQGEVQFPDGARVLPDCQALASAILKKLNF